MVSFSSCNTRQESTKTYLQKCILTDLAFKSLIYSLLEELKWKYKLLKKTNDRTDGRLVWKPEKLSRTLDLPEFSLIKKERFLPITLPSVILSEELQQWDLFEHVNRYLKMHVWRERKVCSVHWSVATLHGQVVSEAHRKDPTGQEGARIHREAESPQPKLNPQRFLAVSLCLLTLSYSIDFFINPLSKCFSLPHSTDISPTPFFPPLYMILVQLFHLVVTSDKRVSLTPTQRYISLLTPHSL